MAPPLSGFDHVHVFVQDRTAAEAWYAKVMGLARSPGLEFWASDGGSTGRPDAGLGPCASSAQASAGRGL